MPLHNAPSLDIQSAPGLLSEEALDALCAAAIRPSDGTFRRLRIDGDGLLHVVEGTFVFGEGEGATTAKAGDVLCPSPL